MAAIPDPKNLKVTLNVQETGMDDQIIAHTGMVGGGESDSVTFTAPKTPGDYEYICTFPGHFAAGMKGKLVVKAQ